MVGPAYFNRGLALAHASEPRGAITAFEQSLRLNPERVESYLYLADLHLRIGERDAALDVLERARVLSPDDSRVKSLQDRAAGRKGTASRP